MSLAGKLAKLGITPSQAAGSGDLTVQDDLTITDDASIGGDLAVTGTLAVTSTSTLTGAVNGGVLGYDETTMAASTVMAATVAAYTGRVIRYGDIAHTIITIDLTGAKSTTTDLDIIGDTGACHIGQVTTALNGAIFRGQISCSEVPTTGADDIDLYCASVATGAYDADASGLTNAAALVTSGGAHAIGTVKQFTGLPTADYYLYLACGEAGTVGTYDAGILTIEMWGIIS